MKTILLARTEAEAKAYADSAELDPRETWLCTPDASGARRLQGLRLSNEDLIAEFPGFRSQPNSYLVIQALNRIMVFGKTRPAWRAIGT